MKIKLFFTLVLAASLNLAYAINETGEFKTGKIKAAPSTSGSQTDIINKDYVVTLQANIDKAKSEIGMTHTIWLIGLVGALEAGQTYDLEIGSAALAETAEEGSALLEVGFTSVKKNGNSATVFTDAEQSKLKKGSLEILSVDGDTFSFEYKAKFAKAVKSVTKPKQGVIGKTGKVKKLSASGNVTVTAQE